MTENKIVSVRYAHCTKDDFLEVSLDLADRLDVGDVVMCSTPKGERRGVVSAIPFLKKDSDKHTTQQVLRKIPDEYLSRDEIGLVTHMN